MVFSLAALLGVGLIAAVLIAASVLLVTYR
jgi:hypothetical protein